jgi:hypothetical protein
MQTINRPLTSWMRARPRPRTRTGSADPVSRPSETVVIASCSLAVTGRPDISLLPYPRAGTARSLVRDKIDPISNSGSRAPHRGVGEPLSHSARGRRRAAATGMAGGLAVASGKACQVKRETPPIPT